MFYKLLVLYLLSNLSQKELDELVFQLLIDAIQIDGDIISVFIPIEKSSNLPVVYT